MGGARVGDALEQDANGSSTSAHPSLRCSLETGCLVHSPMGLSGGWPSAGGGERLTGGMVRDRHLGTYTAAADDRWRRGIVGGDLVPPERVAGVCRCSSGARTAAAMTPILHPLVRLAASRLCMLDPLGCPGDDSRVSIRAIPGRHVAGGAHRPLKLRGDGGGGKRGAASLLYYSAQLQCVAAAAARGGWQARAGTGRGAPHPTRWGHGPPQGTRAYRAVFFFRRQAGDTPRVGFPLATAKQARQRGYAGRAATPPLLPPPDTNRHKPAAAEKQG